MSVLMTSDNTSTSVSDDNDRVDQDIDKNYAFSELGAPLSEASNQNRKNDNVSPCFNACRKCAKKTKIAVCGTFCCRSFRFAPYQREPSYRLCEDCAEETLVIRLKTDLKVGDVIEAVCKPDATGKTMNLEVKDKRGNIVLPPPQSGPANIVQGVPPANAVTLVQGEGYAVPYPA